MCLWSSHTNSRRTLFDNQIHVHMARGISPHGSYDGVHSSSVPSMRRDHLSIFITITSVPG